MATIAIVFTDTSGSGTSTFTLSQADMDRILAFYRQYYPNPNGTPSSKQNALNSMARAAIKEWRDATKSFEAGAVVVPDIPITES